MRNSLLKLCALAALTVLGSGAGFVACGSGDHPRPKHAYYSPFKISIDSIEARGELNVEEKKEHFLLNKGSELILLIPKYEEFGERGFEIVGDPDRVINTTLPDDEILAIDHVIQLSSNNPDVSIRGWENRRIKNPTELTTPNPRIEVRPLGLRDVAISAGVLDQGVAVTIICLELDGKIDDQPFSIIGRVVYDDTEKSRLAVDQKFHVEMEAGAKRRAQIRSQQLNYLILPFAIAIILLGSIIWLVFRLRRSKR